MTDSIIHMNNPIKSAILVNTESGSLNILHIYQK